MTEMHTCVAGQFLGLWEVLFPNHFQTISRGFGFLCLRIGVRWRKKFSTERNLPFCTMILEAWGLLRKSRWRGGERWRWLEVGDGEVTSKDWRKGRCIAFWRGRSGYMCPQEVWLLGSHPGQRSREFLSSLHPLPKLAPQCRTFFLQRTQVARCKTTFIAFKVWFLNKVVAHFQICIIS